MKSVAVFCGSSKGNRDSYVAGARQLGQELAQRDLRLVYGGGNVGLMGILADAAVEHGGNVVGVIPQSLADKELAHHGIAELHVVKSMHERKAMMADLSDAFVAMPGGYGTLDEFCEVLTWTQLRFQSKPCGILNTDGFFDPLLAQFDRAVVDGLLRPEHRKFVVVDDSPARLLEQLQHASVEIPEKWRDLR